jgi:hypothetical protein
MTKIGFSFQPTDMRSHNMNRRSFLMCGAIALNAVLATTGVASAARLRLPTSTLTVNVLVVDRESFNREEIQYPGQPAIAFETTKYVAKAQITKVLESEHGLSAGAVINIRYSVTVRRPPHPAFRVRPMLGAGETITLTVFGGGSSFDWRN